MANLLMKDLNLFETIDAHAASKISGGVLDCTEPNRDRVIAGLQASGLITAAQGTTLKGIPLATFCADIGDALEVRLGADLFRDVTAAVEVEPGI